MRGAKELLLKIGLKDLTFTDEVVTDLNKLLSRLDVGALTSLGLSQPVVSGDYDLKKAKAILKANGFSNVELTDDTIKKILDYRHILIELKQRSVKQLDSLPSLLQLSQ